jgi:hypothetical protein
MFVHIFRKVEAMRKHLSASQPLYGPKIWGGGNAMTRKMNGIYTHIIKLKLECCFASATEVTIIEGFLFQRYSM